MPASTRLFSVFTFATAALLAGCDAYNQLLLSPPVFVDKPYWFTVDHGNDVPFSVYISSGLTTMESVTCASGAIVLAEADSEWAPADNLDPARIKQPMFSAKWSGVAPYSSLADKAGKNEITCKATNENGSVEGVAAIIEYIPDVPPQVVLATTDFLLCGNDGSKVFDIALLDPSSAYVRGAVYILNGYIDPGLKVSYWTGKLSGMPSSGSRVLNNLTLKVSTAAGSVTSAPFSVTVSDVACP